MPEKPKEESKTVELDSVDRLSMYKRARTLPLPIKRITQILIPFDVYLQDPFMAKKNPAWGIDEIFVGWEPRLDDGPTSARIAVVDYNSDTGVFVPGARWMKEENQFVDSEGHPISRKNAKIFQFHQVNVWATIQRALDFFEHWDCLGRPLGWAFEGNRLIVVPHAGYGKNAYYDRNSKSLQFYYFDDDDDERVYTCLSADIVHHELAHAVLDFMRPYYLEGASTVQTSAFHEFFGDISAILLILRHNKFRHSIVKKWGKELKDASVLSDIAEEFGEKVKDQRYLRTAKSELKMGDIEGDLRPHHCSKVLTGAMFKIMIKISKQYMTEKRNLSAKDAFWYTIKRMQRTILHAVNLLPPVDLTFKDYALAVLRAEELSNPLDPHGYFNIMSDEFKERGILTQKDLSRLKEPHYLYNDGEHDIDFDVNFNVYFASRSKAAAYRFLHDNRRILRIPSNQDIIVTDLYDVENSGRRPRRLSRRIVVEYMWREEFKLKGEEYRELDGRTTSLLCGGTLVFDDEGNLLSWFRKPGSKYEKVWDYRRNEKKGLQDKEEGERRLASLKKYIADQVEQGRISLAEDEEGGFFAGLAPPMVARSIDGSVRFEISPHLCIDEDEEMDDSGGRKWAISF